MAFVVRGSLASGSDGNLSAFSGEPSKHLDLVKAEVIKRQWLMTPDDVLDLSGYSTACVYALDHLADIECGFLDLGFLELSPSMARSLAESAAHFLIFSKLEMLTPKAAIALGRNRDHHLVFECLNGITPEITQAMVEATPGSGRILDLRVPFCLTPDLAAILATDPRELWISSLDEPLLSSSARELAFHQGDYLRLSSSKPFMKEALNALSVNPRKRFNVLSPADQQKRYCATAAYGWVIELSEVDA